MVCMDPGSSRTRRRPIARIIGPYAGLFEDRSVRGFVAYGVLGRMAISMLSLGVVLLVSALTDDYALAGLMAAALVCGQAVGAPLIGRLADRYGQGPVLFCTLPVHAVALVGLLLGTLTRQPTAPLLAAAALTGVSFPPIGSLVRTRWAHRVGGTDKLQTAYAFEGVLSELIFVVGPVAVTLLATRIHPAAGVAAALITTLAGGVGFALQRASEPGPQHRTAGRRFILRDPVVLTVTVVTGVTTTGLGALDVATVAFTSAEGARWAAGPVLALVALGSATGGLTYGTIRWKGDPALRYAVLGSCFAILLLPLMFLPSLGWLALMALLCGLAIAPLMVAGNMLVAHGAPREVLTEALTWVTTGTLAGISLGSWLAGQVIDAFGAHHGFVVTSGAALCAGIACWIGRPIISRTQPR